MMEAGLWVNAGGVGEGLGGGFLLCLLLCMFENLHNTIFKKRGQERTPFSVASGPHCIW